MSEPCGPFATEAYKAGAQAASEAERRHYAALVLHARGVVAAYRRITPEERAALPPMITIMLEALSNFPEMRRVRAI